MQDYFALQLKFAEHYATAADVPCSIAIAHCTNLRRRLNLWGPAGETRWNGFLAKFSRSANDHSAALAMCIDLYETRPSLEAERSFGCFSYDPPDATGALRIHFIPPEDTRASPLASASTGARVDELRAMFSHIRRTERNVASVRGVSWLYNLDAYKRLFPLSYAASVQAPWFPLHLNGSSTWGQVLNWRQEVKPAVRDAVLARLPAMKIEAPWEIFPHQALVATGEAGAFYELLT